MKIGISIPPHLYEPEHVFEWVRRVDAGPFSTLSILDRVVYANYEPLLTLAAAAALSTRVRLMTEILLAPLRTTTILAKESATLDALSRGRLTLGLGVGGREDDFLATEADYKHRGHQMEMALETHHIGQGRNNIRDYYATVPPFAASISAALLTTEQQLRETIHALQQIGTDELIFFAWSTELDQIDRVADVIG
jgi:hypothetical protein